MDPIRVSPRLDEAVRLYRLARDAFVRTPHCDPVYWLRASKRDAAHDELVTLLTAHGAVFHHGGMALWVEDGELREARIEQHRAPKPKKGARSS